MNNPFDYTPHEECDRAFARLVARLEQLRGSGNAADEAFCRELEAGKMLGVLIAVDDSGVHHTLYAFSGQVGRGGFYHEGFVGPVFDYLDPEGYFKRGEREISRQNREIALFEAEELTRVRNVYDEVKQRFDAGMAAFKEECRRSRREREAKRMAGMADEVERAGMIRQSQFEKAELRRMKQRAAATLGPYARSLSEALSHLEDMKAKRRADSEALQGWLFTNFRLLNARGEWRSVSDIFAETSLKVPPSGAGECCGPKLLHAAYLQGWRPLSMAEYWYGAPKGGEVRRHGQHYPACRGKCLPVLSWMLQGEDVEPPLGEEQTGIAFQDPGILYENEWFCIVDKPAGMLSVPGRGMAVSVQDWLSERYGAERHVKMAHRLDQDTSGLLIATFGEYAHKEMQTLFATRKVKKIYIADLEGDYRSLGVAEEGRIELPLSPDWLDRPRQRIDREDGKEAVTDYRFLSQSDGRSRVEFRPQTGRTHQLRVHAASAEELGMPIVGDRLYGQRGRSGEVRLHLHAHRVEFLFPIDGRRYAFESPVPF